MKSISLKSMHSVKLATEALLKDDSIVILPTDTVYGLFATVSKSNMELINATKGRDPKKHVAVMFRSLKSAYQYIEVSDEDKELLESNLPGKKTFIVKLKKGVMPEFDEIGKKEIGIRVIDNDWPKIKKIIKATGPLLATSCNEAGTPPLVSDKEINSAFGQKSEINLFVKSNRMENGKKSTKIFDITDGKTIKVVR